MTRTSEEHIANAVVKYLKTVPGQIDIIRNIIAALPDFIQLTPEDEQESETRPGEALWEQSVRNIVSHKNSPGNAIHDGWLAHKKPARLYIPD
jgi:hypothetical protein